MMKKNRMKFLVAIVILLLFIGGRILSFQEMFTIENVNSNLQLVKEFASEQLIITSIIFILIYTVTVAFALPIATIVSIGCGLVMGPKIGLTLAVTAATFGASINFLLIRYILGEQIQKRYKNKLKKINVELNANGKNYLLMLRLMPVFPFFLINLAAGLSNIKFTTFIWTTVIGIIPGTFAYVYLGASLNYLSDENAGLPISVILALVLVGVMALLPVVYSKYKTRKKKA